MTVFQKIISVTFATIILVMSIVMMLTLGGVLDPYLGSDIMDNIVQGNFWSKVLFAVNIVLFIFALKEIAFGQKVISEGREGIVLENESGKLIISKESLENLISGVGKEIEGLENVSSRTFIDIEKNVTVDVNVVVNREVVIKDISTVLQKKIKEALKKTVDLDVKYVNIKIKNISNKKSKKNATTEKVSNNSTEETIEEKEKKE